MSDDDVSWLERWDAPGDDPGWNADDTITLENVDLAGECLAKIDAIVEDGLALHQCGMQHDTMAKVSHILQLGLTPRYSVVGSNPKHPDADAFFPMCTPEHQARCLGCAHAGKIIRNFGNIANRSIDAPARDALVEAANVLGAYASDVMPKEEAESIVAEVEGLGCTIAKCDAELYSGEGAKNRQLHKESVTRLFEIAGVLKGKLEEARKLGKGIGSKTVRLHEPHYDV